MSILTFVVIAEIARELMILALIPLLLLVVPVSEIAVFIVIGGWIGLWPTLGMIVVTALLGTLLLRWQGFQIIQEIRAKSEAGELPGKALVHGAMLLVAGVLLLTPGFVTDTLGFLLFVPQFRDLLWNIIKKNVNLQMTRVETGGRRAPPPHGGGPTIDLDASEFGPPNSETPWSRDNKND